MRTKTLLLTAALCAAGVATSMAAAVYSVNAVGYVNTVVKPGFQIISNPLVSSSSKVGDLIPTAPDGTTIYKYSTADGFGANSFIFGAWGDPNQTLVPGEAAFVYNADTAPFTITFVGEVPQSVGATPLSNPVPAQFSLVSSVVPKSGSLTALGFPAAENDTVYVYVNNRVGAGGTEGYESNSYIFGAWGDPEPVIGVGQGFFSFKAASAPWDVTFHVNDQ